MIIAAILFLSCYSFSGLSVERSKAVIMHDVFEALSYLLPLSLTEEDNYASWDREEINQNLKMLQSAAEALKDHSADEPPEFNYLARSFEELPDRVASSFSS